VSAASETALAWAARGRPVFPAGLDKRPLVSHGLLDASADIKQVAAWWSCWPQANIALRTGEASGIVVIDIDGVTGADSLHALERDHGALPATASVVTPRGGEHYLLQWPGVPVKTTAGVIAPGVDCRGDGGYVLVPPSRTAHGTYCWDSELPPAPMPPWLIDLACEARTTERAPAPPSVWTAMVRDGIPEGQRNASLARLTGHLLRRWLDVELAAELVALVNEHRCRPPLPTAELERIIDSIATREAQRLQGRTP
jgi:Bifunctional DNA primase/polymerase, N-terminal/Primase C terminal 1 (PriCT-1)